ncbi:S8 family serine peptidase [Aquimarina hainanensis]|uniref:S8 family serine peptidase n=1 Tax=Aquimarina hainanensis TaxID=1578017 RepID=A0ABW5N3W3_9FLAO
MNKKKWFSGIILLCYIVFWNINAQQLKKTTLPVSVVKDTLTSIKDIKNIPQWYYKDIIADSLPGISLDKAYKKLSMTGGDTVIVAVIDMPVYIAHPALKEQIWVNTKEIPNNGIDDDQNGYIDDLHGWNFLGKKDGTGMQFVQQEYARILFRDNLIFSEGEKNGDSAQRQEYLKAKEKHSNRMAEAVEIRKNATVLYKDYFKAKRSIEHYFGEVVMEVDRIDSLKQRHSDNDSLQYQLLLWNDCIKNSLSEEWVVSYKKKADQRIAILLNIERDVKKEVDSFPENKNYINYGHHNIAAHASEMKHGTLVAGMLGVSRNSAIDNFKGISDRILVMPICVSANGDPHDKDIALAIRYAVDQGAKVINMSFGKAFSLHPEWVDEALEYAEKKGVLVVTSAGNTATNLNENTNRYYPNDYGTKEKEEVVDNVIMVGASSYLINSKLAASFSSYGNRYVDIFAPGDQIRTTVPEASYRKDRGTSLSSALVSGIAALLYQYYPTLEVGEIKEIILKSGVRYTFPVAVPGAEKNEKMPFSSLSKSGSIANAYRALLMAEKKVASKAE